MSKIITACAPGKIILSGEHAVVYGSPALAMAVNYSITTTIKPRLDNNICFCCHCEEQSDAASQEKSIGIASLTAPVMTKVITTLQDLKMLRAQIDQCAKKFNLSNELIQYTLIYILENLDLKLESGLQITINSTIPVGCGMGSSAAMILSLMQAILGYFNREISNEQRLEFGRSIENLQHGKSSGTDLFLSLYGGCYFSSAGKFNRRDLPKMPLFLVNTKKPASSTGDCVSKVAKFFHGSSIAADFAAITTELDQALVENNALKIQEYILENHKLLKYIGVVPEQVCEFISEIEKLGNAAKISGAGAVSGMNAGMVLVAGEANFHNLVNKYGYEILPLVGENNGARVISS